MRQSQPSCLYFFGPSLWQRQIFGLAFVAEALDVFGALFEGGDIAALDLFASLGHVGNDVDSFGAGNFADHGFDGEDDFVLHGFGGRNAGLQGDVDDGDAAFDFVNGGDDGGFGDFR